MSVIIFIQMMVFVHVLAFEDFVFGDSTSDILKKGKLQYQILQEKGKMPQYGECWKTAISHLHDGCKSLSEETQAGIALRFTNCFLEMSGHETYNCDTDKKPNLRRICISSMSDRAFSVYTEFYTHSQNICFFLRNQIWHEETEKTIDKLSSSSAHVSDKLEEAGQKTESILKQQEESIMIQERLLKYGDSLTKTLEDSQHSIDHIMEEFRSSTMEQKRILFDLFDRLSALQSWLLGEVSWFDSIVFYVSSVIVITLLTSSKRTANGRVICFILLTFHACLERYICTMILDRHKFEGVDFVNEVLLNAVWWLRRFTVGMISIVYVYTAYNYRDYSKLNYELLLLLKDQNERLKIILERIDKEEDKISSDKSELNASIDAINRRNLSRKFYHNIEQVDRLDKLSMSRDYENNLFESEDTFDDLSKSNHYFDSTNRITSTHDYQNGFKSKYSNNDNIRSYSNDVSSSLINRKYNLRSNSRQVTPVNDT